MLPPETYDLKLQGSGKDGSRKDVPLGRVVLKAGEDKVINLK